MPPKSADAKKAVGGVRGVSAEEKSRRMLEIFKSAEVYSLKELEKLGAKKGAQPRDRPVDFIFPNASFYQHIFFGTNREKRRITNT